MKKALLYSLICFIFFPLVAFGYETIIIDFPLRTKWEVIYYKKYDTEAILQYIPAGQDRTHWKQSVVVHSYKGYEGAVHKLADRVTARLYVQNPTGRFKYLRYASVDCVAVRSTTDYKGIKGQSEILRVTKGSEGSMTIQYLDRDKAHFKKNYNTWLKIIKEARLYNSYWRDNRVLNKSESFEL